MTEQENTKVYELAKELGIDSISLLDKLKTLNIKVKNHMSELAEADLQVARTALKKATETPAAEKKTAAPKVRKKAAATTEVTSTPTAPKTGLIKTGTKTTSKATATAESAEKKASSPIIRRRTKADGATETYTQGLSAPSPEATTQQKLQEATEQEKAIETSSAVKSAAVEQITQEQAQQEVDTPPPPATSAPVIRHAPRKNILTVVESKPIPPKPVIKPAVKTSTPAGATAANKATPTEKDGYRVFRMTKESIDQMVEEEAAKKRASRSEVDIRPEDVRFADYRKKEMVFLPKKKKIPLGKELKRTQITMPSAQKRVVEMQEMITVQDLANQLHIKTGDVIKKLMSMGQMATVNQALDFDTATLVASEYQFEIKNIAFNEAASLGITEDSPESLVPRPPVVTIMGHVDHGKTTLLDSIRSAKVAEGEAGGITQHIGAYTVVSNGKPITFLDTPGHEAFSMMRARGANLTDIVVLVVSADDGVMPQTREAASHAQAAKVPIIVAVNKIDKPGANPEKVKQGLSELNLLAEDWGGDTMFVPVSALKKTNLDKLLEAILLQAEVLDLKGNPNALASGTVLEARLEKGRGPVVNVLVSRGTLKVGDSILSGVYMGRVKAMTNDKGQMMKEVTPGTPVEVLGFEGVPHAGEKFYVAAQEADARKVIQHRMDQLRMKNTSTGPKVSLEDLFAKTQTGNEPKELKVIVKADVYGSVEALKHSLEKLSTPKVKTTVIHFAPGGITETDVHLAKASNAIIIGFNVRPETKARQLAESEQVEIITGNIIYEVIDTIKNAMTGLLDKKKIETFLGRAEVRQVFSIPKFGVIAGSAVIDGKILRGANVRLLRDSKIVYEGKMSSLKRFKEDAKEVATGFECGIGIENYNDLKAGDIIEAYQIELQAQTSLDAS